MGWVSGLAQGARGLVPCSGQNGFRAQVMYHPIETLQHDNMKRRIGQFCCYKICSKDNSKICYISGNEGTPLYFRQQR